MIVITSPNSAKYEATVTYDLRTQKMFVSPKEVSRLNAYGRQPECVAKEHPHLRAYCFCSNQWAVDELWLRSSKAAVRWLVKWQTIDNINWSLSALLMHFSVILVDKWRRTRNGRTFLFLFVDISSISKTKCLLLVQLAAVLTSALIHCDVILHLLRIPIFRVHLWICVFSACFFPHQIKSISHYINEALE